MLYSQANSIYAVLAHGERSTPGKHWFPWLTAQMEQRKVQVAAPQFPTPHHQDLTHWLETMSPYWPYLGTNSLLVGHDIGATFILRALERLRTPICAAFLVAPPMSEQEAHYGSTLASFTDTSFDWAKIRSNCAQFVVYQSDNDPYVPLESGQNLAANLGVDLTLLPGCGHFDSAAGFLKFNRLLEDITVTLSTRQGAEIVPGMHSTKFLSAHVSNLQTW